MLLNIAEKLLEKKKKNQILFPTTLKIYRNGGDMNNHENLIQLLLYAKRSWF